jgi:DNA helicase-4
MKRSTKILYIILVILTVGIFYYFWDRNVKRKDREKELQDKLRREEETRKGLYDFFKLRIAKIKEANSNFTNHLKNEKGYFSNYQLTVWRKQHSALFDEIKDRPFEHIKLDNDEVGAIKAFINYSKNYSTIRTEFNTQFIAHELKSYRDFFEKIEKHGLDKEQQIAVVTDDDNNIVIAGAGSGKTTTIVGKVNYVIDRYKILPTEILLISFTNKSATTLAQRIDFEGVEAKTFHKFGKDVICAVEDKQPSIFDESQFKPLLTKYFKELIQSQNYLQNVTTYFVDFLKPEKPQDEFENQGEYFQYLKDQNFKTYKAKEIPYKGKTTYKMEVVKSIEECKIANFLLFNGVDYEYELPYKYDTATQAFRQYKPDFTINPKSDTVYLEHFAINKKGEVPHFFAKTEQGQTIQQATKEYADGIIWKRSVHKTNETPLIETYSHEMFDGVLFDNLTQRLIKSGIQLYPKTPEEIWKIISEAAKDEVDNFITLFQTFITLMKSNNYKIVDVVKKNKAITDKFHQQRNALFIEIITPIFEKYEKYLAERNEIDFSDMINKASKYIANNQFKRKFSYIIIDEFQDISIGRYQLVKAIKDRNPSCKLFCVGDDWQSIYRFSGSDISLFKNFESFFGHTVKSKIETTYRFHNPLINLSSDFILKNPNQAKKELTGTGVSKSTKHKIVYSISDNQDDTFALRQIFDDLLLTDDFDKKEIYVLGRYSFDIDRIKNEQNTFHIDKSNGIINYLQRSQDLDSKRLIAQFMTVHKAKGLEADIIIILNCNSGKHGFPSEMSDDTVLNLLLSEADQFENGEERRLFYVAMTRAKEMVYFVADSSYKSKFISELEIESGDSTIKKCPKCKTADLIKRSGTKNNKQWAFYGCSNFMYGCSHQEWV